ncbi:hypothetical protein, partial [Kytococcus schroeteri]|uniref:hypothetical protein n=1 Tax=Kytococcus schroeteri TaxID=138300 RepID=UPI00192CED87
MTGDAEMQRTGYLQYESSENTADALDDVEFQRSGLSLGRLTELFEMVSEVLEQRLLRVASELALAQQELEHLNLADPVRRGEAETAMVEPVEEAEEWQEGDEGA